MAIGMLSVNEQAGYESWLTELLGNNESLSEENKSILVKLFEETRRLFFSEDFEFGLFLPEVDMPLSLQVQALTDWCRGFLLGVGSKPASNYSRDALEILRDIAEFTKLDTDVEGEED